MGMAIAGNPRQPLTADKVDAANHVAIGALAKRLTARIGSPSTRERALELAITYAGQKSGDHVHIVKVAKAFAKFVAG